MESQIVAQGRCAQVFRAALATLAGAALLCPQPVRAHVTEFILAKVRTRPGYVEVELTADYGENPMIPGGEAEAREVLARVLRIRTAEGEGNALAAVKGSPGRPGDAPLAVTPAAAARALADLAPLRFEKRTQVDPEAPIPRMPGDEAGIHQLLAARWSWRCDLSSVSLEVPPDAGQSLILWTPAEPPATQPRWMFLLAGEESPGIPVPPGGVLSRLPAGIMGAGIAIAVSMTALLLWLEARRAKLRKRKESAA